MKNFAEIMLMIPYSILGAYIGQKWGHVTALAGSFAGSLVASLLISLL